MWYSSINFSFRLYCGASSPAVRSLRCAQIILDKYLFVVNNSHIYLPQIGTILQKHVFSNNCLHFSHFRFQKRKKYGVISFNDKIPR